AVLSHPGAGTEEEATRRCREEFAEGRESMFLYPRLGGPPGDVDKRAFAATHHQPWEEPRLGRQFQPGDACRESRDDGGGRTRLAAPPLGQPGPLPGGLARPPFRPRRDRPRRPPPAAP